MVFERFWDWQLWNQFFASDINKLQVSLKIINSSTFLLIKHIYFNLFVVLLGIKLDNAENDFGTRLNLPVDIKIGVKMIISRKILDRSFYLVNMVSLLLT